ncbi:hypothetical protein HNR47_003279 [Methylopila jiangsuensis]|uniref:DUF2478 domain-containing protein n=1 Tax=Methylopila jiangsuensis TaxID=586230 RepID=UPI0022F3288D|nr:DUF2478 domain-containing protein [Methylopila jiangsuensis]MDR6287249.1 hypothetical protein [Methylopila jiangsuensis]
MDRRLIALQNGASEVVGLTLARFAALRQNEGLRVAGCVEETAGVPGSGCAGRTVRDLATGRRHVIGQDLGPGSLACHLDPAGVAAACADALEAIEAGCDLVVLSKFGKLEADRSGLVDAFAAAILRDLPVVTSVAPSFSRSWSLYAGDLAAYAEPTDAALERWWRAVRPDSPLRAAG